MWGLQRYMIEDFEMTEHSSSRLVVWYWYANITEGFQIMKYIKHVVVGTAFLSALFVVASTRTPYVSLVPEAHAGVKECKQRCFEKYAACDSAHKKSHNECLSEQQDCQKDCEANAK